MIATISSIGWKGLIILYLFVFIVYAVLLPLLARVVPIVIILSYFTFVNSLKVFAQEKAEGFFRYAHARVRNYAESIAFYNVKISNFNLFPISN